MGDYYIPNLNTVDPNDKIKLDEKPWVALKDTNDKSFYLRLLAGIYFNKSAMDFYIGLKRTTIKNTATVNQDLLDKAEQQGYDLLKVLDRDETMYMLGFNYTLESKDFIYEFEFEYDKFQRYRGLDYIDYNYIVDAGISYKMTKNFLLFSGARVMYRQLNGEIPYLYNKYSQTSYDHKYGYARFGMQYSF